jgi:hypothetical protein
VANQKKPAGSVHMACKDVGRLRVGASQFGTAARQVFELPANVVTSVTDGGVQPVPARTTNDPFFSSRLDVARKRQPLDTTPFVDTAVSLINVEVEAAVDEPVHPRRIVMMKKRG